VVVLGQRDEQSEPDPETVEQALREADPDRLADPESVVDTLFTDTFVREHTDFPDFEAFLDHAGVDDVWAFDRWLDWVLDWHVLGNTRFWSWEWMVHAAVALRADAERVGELRCGACGGPVDPVTGSAIEEPGRTDAAWVDYRCDCGAEGRAEIREPDGGVRLTGDVAWSEAGLPAVRAEGSDPDADGGNADAEAEREG
jgi:hypothetical protein